MFQSFNQKSERAEVARRVEWLRAEMPSLGVDAVIVPRADAWHGEWVQPKDERLAWISGFTGSAGMAAIGQNRAALFVDGRYRLQANAESDTSIFEVLRIPEDSLIDWLVTAFGQGARIGIDPWLTSLAEYERWSKELKEKAELVSLTSNPIDSLRATLPESPSQDLSEQPLEWAGTTAAAKQQQIAEGIKAEGAAAALIVAPDSIAWLLNLRGHLIPRAPMVHGFCLVQEDATLDLWLPEPPPAAIVAALGPTVRLIDLDSFRAVLDQIDGKTLIDKQNCPLALIPDGGQEDQSWLMGTDPCALPKACKNEAEQAGARLAHDQDAIAMVRFLAWAEGQGGRSPGLSEIEVVEKLEAFRRDTPELLDISFETIAGAGPNGAIVHYRVNEVTNRTAEPGEIILVDSGGQYRYGTTDITRVLATGDASEEICRAYTRVLQGLIALTTLRFPKGLTGRDIDSIARAPLWREGWDYDHGTGHGVGSYLSVHEGPQGLSRRNIAVLEPGMILSIEPGYYREGAFGIRLENLVVVVPVTAEPGREMLGFATLTKVPFERRLIRVDLLSQDELAWLDAYHLSCRDAVLGKLDAETEDWLLRATAPLAQS